MFLNSIQKCKYRVFLQTVTNKSSITDTTVRHKLDISHALYINTFDILLQTIYLGQFIHCTNTLYFKFIRVTFLTIF